MRAGPVKYWCGFQRRYMHSASLLRMCLGRSWLAWIVVDENRAISPSVSIVRHCVTHQQDHSISSFVNPLRPLFVTFILRSLTRISILLTCPIALPPPPLPHTFLPCCCALIPL